jgi:lipoprotein-anchoring transpeptidase ErfK/SrfK
VLETPIAVQKYPTPAARFFVTDLLDTGEGGGAYGPYAVGLSAHSDVLTEFGGGDGQVGIHGTNDQSSIGRPVSHGRVRVANDVITRLATTIPIGTQVTIV